MTAKIILISKFFLQSVFLVLLATNSAWAGDFQCTRINEGYEELFPKHIKLAYTDWKPKSKESSSIINYKNGQKIQLTKNGKLVVVGFANGAIRYNCDKNSMDVINAPKVKKTSDLGVCQWAVKNGMWDRRQESLIYVQEAKERGLGCGVSLQGNVRKVTEVSSTDKRWWLWPRPWTPNQAAFVSGQLLKMGGEINSATGAISDVPVANGFLNMDKHGVVTYIGAPDQRYRGPYEHLITSASTTQKDPTSVASKASNPDNDEVVNGMIADAKKLAKASPGKCVDIFPDEVNQQSADYKVVYLPNRKFKSFKSMAACVDHMMALYKSGGSYPRDMIEKANKRKRRPTQPSMQTLAKTQFDPVNAKSFFCPGRKKLFGRTSDAQCHDMLFDACTKAHPYESLSPVVHAYRMTCYITSFRTEFPNDPDLSLFVSSVKERRAIFVMSAQGAIPLPKAIQLSDRIMEDTRKIGLTRNQSRRNQGLKTAMLGFCMAQGHSIASCMGVPSNSGQLDIASHGVLKKSIINGPNRICLYDNVGSEFAVTVRATDLCAMSRASSNQESSFAASGGHLINNYIDGHNRICIYDNAGSLFLRTVESTSVCAPSL